MSPRIGMEGAASSGSAVTSVASRTGDVVLTKTDVGLANVDNTADTAKPVSTAQAAADALAVPLAGGTSTGEQVAPSFKASGKTGATATPITLAGGTASGPPTTGAHVKGEIVVDDTGRPWYCTVAGTPGTWVVLGRAPLLHVRDEKANTTHGGTFTSGAWRTRDLNTIVTNELGVTLVANVITGLVAGTYEFEARAPAYVTSYHKARLYDVTGAAQLGPMGSNERASTTAAHISQSFASGRFTLTATSDLRLEHWCATTEATDGFGPATSLGVVEVYSDVQIRRVG